MSIAQSLLTDARDGWDEPRPIDTWFELVPAPHQRGADLEWMKLSLALAKSPLRESDLEKAAKRVPPGAYRIVRTLQSVGILHAASNDDRLRFEPRWFSRALFLEARSALVASSPFEWGEALLQPLSAPAIAASLNARFPKGDYRLIEDVLDLSADESPAQVAALESVFVAAGLHVLAGGELPLDQLEALWDEQVRLHVALPRELPRRRVEHRAPGEPLLAESTWLLAALALSEQLPRARGLHHPLLRPWLASTPAPELRVLYDAIAAGLATSRADFCSLAFSLIDRLRAAIGSIDQTGGAPHSLELPGMFLDEVMYDVLEWQTFASLSRYVSSLAAVTGLAKQRELAWEQVAGAILQAWQAAGYPEQEARVLIDSTDWRARVWPYATIDWLTAWIAQSTSARTGAYAELSEEQWFGLESALDAGALRDEADAFRHAPAALVTRVLSARTDPVPAPVAHALWVRDSALALDILEMQLRSRHYAGALVWLNSSPRPMTAAVVRVLCVEVDARNTPLELLDPMRAWLHARVAERASEWQEAYALFAQLERALIAVRAEAWSARPG